MNTLSDCISQTLTKFQFPHSLIKSYQYWHLLLRPQQVTLGSLVLVCKENTECYSSISAEAAKEQHMIVQEVEHCLKSRFNYSKINYLMLMLVDPAVHFHIIPRYQQPVYFNNNDYQDSDWPNPPNLGKSLIIEDKHFHSLLQTLRKDFAGEPHQASHTKPYNNIYTSGCFDLFHQGHLNILKKSKEIGEQLIVGVSTDELIEKEKGKNPLIPFEERKAIIESIRYVDKVIPQHDKNKQNVVDKYQIDAITVGSDWKGKYPKVSCEMVYFDYTPSVSSSQLKADIFSSTD